MRLLPLLLFLSIAGAGAHEEPATARYIANAGVLVAHGDTRIVFDPLFREDFGQYRLPPADIREALLAGRPPWHGVDAVFISHYHDDHFEPAELIGYLRAQPELRLYAPAQAAAALLDAAGSDAADLAGRIDAVRLAYGDRPRRISLPGLAIDAVRIPHAGWPERLADVENIAWRITLDDGPTVLHLGDADTARVHFASDSGFWRARPLHLALPPYWFFLSPSGLAVLDEELQPALAVGVHVPVSVPERPAARDAGLRDADLFIRPGETREIPESRRDSVDGTN